MPRCLRSLCRQYGCIYAGRGILAVSIPAYARLDASSLSRNATHSPGKIPSHADTAIKVATSTGTVVGQVGFGILADIVGRKKMYGMELILIIFATLAQSLSAHSPACSIVGVIVFWRVLMGIGIGGDYPLSSIITSEFATTRWRGAMMAAVFAMQGIGQFAAAIVSLIVTTAYKSTLEHVKTVDKCTGSCNLAVDRMWRIVIGFGAVPGCVALYYRLTIPETPRYTFDVDRDVIQAGSDVKAFKAGVPRGQVDEITRARAKENDAPQLDIPRASWSDFFNWVSKWKNGKVLIGTAGSWFLLDVAFYGKQTFVLPIHRSRSVHPRAGLYTSAFAYSLHRSRSEQLHHLTTDRLRQRKQRIRDFLQPSCRQPDHHLRRRDSW